jgi:DNA invertase Pin-like site-specific DNA recombinase
MNAVGYTRVSTEEQAEYGHSMEAQEALIRDFAGARGWQVQRIYSDPGRTGRNGHRPGLEQLIKDAQRGQFDVVIVHAIDRLYRNLEALLKTLQLLREHNVAFVSVSESLDFTTPWGKLTLAVLGTLAEIYIDKLSAETTKGKVQRARKGLWNGSIPLGYCDGRCSSCHDVNGPGYCPYVGGPDRGDGKVLVAHPIESVTVRLAFQWYSGGEFSTGDIAEKLNAAHHTLPDGT